MRHWTPHSDDRQPEPGLGTLLVWTVVLALFLWTIWVRPLSGQAAAEPRPPGNAPAELPTQEQVALLNQHINELLFQLAQERADARSLHGLRIYNPDGALPGPPLVVPPPPWQFLVEGGLVAPQAEVWWIHLRTNGLHPPPPLAFIEQGQSWPDTPEETLEETEDAPGGESRQAGSPPLCEPPFCY